MIRQVAVTCEEIGAAICAPAMSIGYAKLATKAGVGFVPITADVVRERFEKRMSHALEEVRELYKLNVEARVHLMGSEVRVFGLFIAACHSAEETARSALGYDDALSSPKARDQLSARLSAANDDLIDFREHVVRVLTPVARDGRESDERCPEAAPNARNLDG